MLLKCWVKNVTLQYRTPTGFIVNNKYNEFEKPVVKIKMWDAEIGRERAYKHTVQEKITDVVRTRKSMNTVAPNIVHSLDASILILAGVLILQNGMTHMMTVHDSFACHQVTWNLWVHVSNMQWLKSLRIKIFFKIS